MLYCSVQYYIVLPSIIYRIVYRYMLIIIYSIISYSIYITLYRIVLYSFYSYCLSLIIFHFLLKNRKKNSILFYPIPSHWLSWDHHTLISMSLPIQPSHSFQLMFLNWWWLVEVVGGCVRCSNYSSYYYFYYIALCLQSTCHQFSYLLVLLCSAQPYLAQLITFTYIYFYIFIYLPHELR